MARRLPLLLACAAAVSCSGGAPAPDVTVAVVPAAATVAVGAGQDFVAAVSGTADTRVAWSVSEGSSGGTIQQDGTYVAPSTVGTYHVVASSVADPQRSGTAVVTVVVSPVVTVTISPRTPTVAVGGSVDFTAAVTGTAQMAVVWSVAEPGGGSITAQGRYTAPSTAGTYHVVATSVADPTRSDVVAVTVTSTPVGIRAQLDVLATKKIYFGHNSVGAETLGTWIPSGVTGPIGVTKLIADNPGVALTVRYADAGLVFTAGTWANSDIGTNGNPLSKISAFDSMARGGRIAGADFAFMKLCFIDFGPGTNANDLFASYKSTLSALKAAYPSTRFVHLTAPLTSAYAADWNSAREAYNDLLRGDPEIQADGLFDLADWECRNDGGVCQYARASGDGQMHRCQNDAWRLPGDEGHVNGAGANWLATHLVEFLASRP